jgi:hypothetical protein
MRNPWTLVGALTALALAAGCAPAPSAGSAGPGGGSAGGGATALQVVFTDPTENAFTIQAPQGWSVTGGVHRTSAWIATPWTIATSPDGTSSIVIGDPSIPTNFTLPSQYNAAGSTAQATDGSPSPVEPYENGAQFAATYAQQVFGPSCSPLQPTGTGAEPALAQAAQAKAASTAAQVGVQPAPIGYDGGSAHFTCQSGAATFAVGVLAVTGGEQTQVGGFWMVQTLIAYRAPLASQAQIEALARAMQQSYQANATWQAQMVSAARQELATAAQQGAQGMAQMQQLQSQQFASADSQMQGAQAARNAEQSAFMTQFNAQGAAFQAGTAQQQYNQETQAQQLTRMAGSQYCVAWYDAAHTRCQATAPN